MPIEDTPSEFEELTKAMVDARGEEPEQKKEEPPEWEKAFSSLSEQFNERDKAFNDKLDKLSQAVAYSAATRQAPPAEEPRRQEAPKQSGWRSKLKEEQIGLLEEAVNDLVGNQLGQFQQNTVDPSLKYVVNTQRKLYDQYLASQYPDDDFGYGALKPKVDAYLQATGYQLDPETAYRQVAFAEMNEAMMNARMETAKAAKKGKRNEQSDEGTTTPRDNQEDNQLSSDERFAARSFFPEMAPDKAEAFYLKNKKAAIRGGEMRLRRGDE